MIFLAVITLCIVVRKYADSLNATLKDLLSFRTNITRINETTIDMKHSVETINATISPDYFSNSSEKQLLMGLAEDELRHERELLVQFKEISTRLGKGVN